MSRKLCFDFPKLHRFFTSCKHCFFCAALSLTQIYLHKYVDGTSFLFSLCFCFSRERSFSGNSIKALFDVKALKLVHEMMEHFTNNQIQLSCCKIIAQLAMGKNNDQNNLLLH